MILVLAQILPATAESSGGNIPGPAVYVSPLGNDTYPGTIEQPLRTLNAAQRKVREIKAAETEPINVIFRQGVYTIDETVVFGLEDSGTREASITYVSYPGETAEFCGAIRIPESRWQRTAPPPGWERVAHPPSGLSEEALKHVWQVHVGSLMKGSFYVRSLYDGYTRLRRAATPGFAPQARSKPETREQKEAEFHSLYFPKGTVEDYKNLEDAELVIQLNRFAFNRLPVKRVDVEAGLLETGLRATYAMNPADFLPDDIACIENVPEGLDEPGEWCFVGSTRMLYYWPESGTPGDNIFMPVVTEMIRVEGDIDFMGPEDRPVQHINFKNLRFTRTDRTAWTTNEVTVQHDWASVDKNNGMLRFRGAEHCTVDGCEFYAGSEDGVRLDLHAQDITVKNSLFHHLGGTAIFVGGYGPGTKNANKHNEIVNNHIHHNGELYPCASAIYIYQSEGNRIAHNLIHHQPYSGINLHSLRILFLLKWPSLGDYTQRESNRAIRFHETFPIVCKAEMEEYPQAEQWYFAQFLHSRKNIVEYNDISRVVEKMGDGNAIYLSGAGHDNRIQYNYIHHLMNGHTMGTRTDEIQQETYFIGNIFYKVRGCGMVMKGKNYLIGNIICGIPNEDLFAYISIQLGPTVGGMPTTPARIEKNVIYHIGDLPHDDPSLKGWQVHPLFYTGRLSKEELAAIEADHNIFYADNMDFLKKRIAYHQKEYGNEMHSQCTDPGFVDAANGDFRLKEDSPLRWMGFDYPDLTNSGLTSDYPEHLKERNPTEGVDDEPKH